MRTRRDCGIKDLPGFAGLIAAKLGRSQRLNVMKVVRWLHKCILRIVILPEIVINFEGVFGIEATNME